MRGLVGIATILLLVLVAAAPALARVDQATERAVSQAQAAVKQSEGNAVYQAINQAQGTKQGVEQSPVETGGLNTTSSAVFLLCTVSLLIVGGFLISRLAKRQGKNHTFGSLDSSFRRMQTQGRYEKMSLDERQQGNERGINSGESAAKASGDYIGRDSHVSIRCPSGSCQR